MQDILYFLFKFICPTFSVSSVHGTLDTWLIRNEGKDFHQASGLRGIFYIIGKGFCLVTILPRNFHGFPQCSEMNSATVSHRQPRFFLLRKQIVSFVASSSTVESSHRKRVSAGTSHGSCHDQRHNKRNTLYLPIIIH